MHTEAGSIAGLDMDIVRTINKLPDSIETAVRSA
jgi:hypothetical protein